MDTILLHWHDYFKVLVGLLAIVNPLLAIPAFIALSPDDSERARRKAAGRTALAVAVIISVTVIAGEPVLQAFGIRIAAFQVGGGILILLMAIAMLHARMSGARHTHDEAEEARGKEDIAVVPLAMPLLAGPGAISTAIIGMQRSDAPYHWLGVVLVIVAVSLVLWVVMRLAEPIAKRLGDTGLNILNRVFGLLLAAIAVEVIANGLRQLFPLLGPTA